MLTCIEQSLIYLRFLAELHLQRLETRHLPRTDSTQTIGLCIGEWDEDGDC